MLGWGFLFSSILSKNVKWRIIMAEIKVQFPDGNEKAFEKGTTTEEIAQSISPGLRKKPLQVNLINNWSI